mgnify:CR=1 FL=1
MKIRENKPALLTILALGLTVMATSSVSACDDEYFARRDSIAIGLGDANATNIAVQTIDPWPASAHNTRISVNGKRIRRGISAYERNKSKEPRPFTASELGTRSNSAGSSDSGDSTGLAK